MKDRALFLRNLKAWTPHVLLAAAPSFIVAYGVEFNRAQSVVGMIAGILVFLVLYPLVWSSAWFRRRVPENSAWDRAFTYGARIRSFLGLMGLIGILICLLLVPHADKSKAGPPPPLAVPFLVLLIPDLCTGALSGVFINWAAQSPLVRTVRVAIGGADAHQRSQSLAVGDVNSLVPTFVTTLAQGLLLTLMLLLFALACRGIMWLNAWRRSRFAGSNVQPTLLTS